MKKFIFIFSLISFVVLLSTSALAIDWSPSVYDMPRTVITQEQFKNAFSGLKNTLRSIGDTGLEIFAILASVTLIATISSNTIRSKNMMSFGLKSRERQRKIRFLDRSRNMNSIVNDRVGSMEVQMFAKTRFRLKHPNADLDEKIYQRELSFLADQKMKELHPERSKHKGKR